jgi:DNA polymerase III delta subunit
VNDRQLYEQLKKHRFHNKYLLIGDEPLLIENAVKAIKNAINVNESFDLDTFSLSEAPADEIISKLYLVPFSSTQRLLIVKNLEDVDRNDLRSFAAAINRTKSKNCIILIYKVNKERKKFLNISKKISEFFPNAQPVIFTTDKNLIRKWILSKTKRDKIKLSSSMINYLVDEFSNDITGLKNEFEKIENYLYEAKELSHDSMRDLAKGLCDFDKYNLVDTILSGKTKSIEQFEELRPYLHSYAEIIDVLTRGLVYYIRGKREKSVSNSITRSILDDIVMMDRKIKKGSYLGQLVFELFLLRSSKIFEKGAVYGG